MFILTNVYPVLVIKMIQMDGKGRGADDVVPYLTVALLSRAPTHAYYSRALSCTVHLDACRKKLFAI